MSIHGHPPHFDGRLCPHHFWHVSFVKIVLKELLAPSLTNENTLRKVSIQVNIQCNWNIEEIVQKGYPNDAHITCRICSLGPGYDVLMWRYSIYIYIYIYILSIIIYSKCLPGLPFIPPLFAQRCDEIPFTVPPRFEPRSAGGLVGQGQGGSDEVDGQRDILAHRGSLCVRSKSNPGIWV